MKLWPISDLPLFAKSYLPIPIVTDSDIIQRTTMETGLQAHKVSFNNWMTAEWDEHTNDVEKCLPDCAFIVWLKIKIYDIGKHTWHAQLCPEIHLEISNRSTDSFLIPLLAKLLKCFPTLRKASYKTNQLILINKYSNFNRVLEKRLSDYSENWIKSL